MPYIVAMCLALEESSMLEKDLVRLCSLTKKEEEIQASLPWGASSFIF